MIDRVLETWVLGFGSDAVEKMGLRQVEQGFSSFFAKFLLYLMIFKEKHAEGTANILQKMK